MEGVVEQPKITDEPAPAAAFPFLLALAKSLRFLARFKILMKKSEISDDGKLVDLAKCDALLMRLNRSQ